MMITCDDLLVLVLQLFLIQRCSFTFISFNNDIDADNMIFLSLGENTNPQQHEIINIIVVVHKMITKRKNDSSIYTVIIPLIDNVEIVISSIGYIIIARLFNIPNIGGFVIWHIIYVIAIFETFSQKHIFQYICY